jgi:hypothetical protein
MASEEMMTDETDRQEIKDRIAIAVFNNVPDDTPITAVRELIERMTDITVETIAALAKDESSGPIPLPTGPITHTPPTAFQPPGRVLPPPTYELPVTIPVPIYNEDGFGVGFDLVHPPDVECVFPPNTKQCSCGKMEPGD